MDNEKGLLVWIGAFTGVALIYAAIKNKPLVEVLQSKPGAATPKNVVNGVPLAPVGTYPTTPLPGPYGTSTLVDGGLGANKAYQDGHWLAVDSYGTPIGVLPDVYQGSPGTWIKGSLF